MGDPTRHLVGLSPTGKSDRGQVTQERHSLCKELSKGLGLNLTCQDIIPQFPPSPRDGVSGFAAHPALPNPLSGAGVPNHT